MSLHIGHVLDVLRDLAADGARAQCVVTSPPYWGLRDYGTRAAIWGGAPMCKHAFGAPARVRRGGGQGATGQRANRANVAAQNAVAVYDGGEHCTRCDAWRGHLGLEAQHDCLAWARGEPPCTSCFVCHMRTVFAAVHEVLADDGACWINLGDRYAGGGRGPDTKSTLGGSRRSQAESRRALVKGRHLPIGLKHKDLAGIPWRVALALQADGWYLRRDNVWHKLNPMPESAQDRPTTAHEYVFLLTKRSRYYYNSKGFREPVTGRAHARGNGLNPKAKPVAGWAVGPGDHSTIGHARRQGAGAHKLLRPRQNESFSTAVNDLVDDRNMRSVWPLSTQPYKGPHFATFPTSIPERAILLTTRPDDVVLDPFMGSGTVARVATRLGRRWLGIDLDPRNEQLTRQRAATTQGLALT